MKRLMVGGVFVMAVAACSTPAWAQVGGGVKAGVNFASLSGLNDGGARPASERGWWRAGS
jgi:hypothetical protein